MADLFELTPELLLQQSQEMLSLRAAYEALFSTMGSQLRGLDAHWSDQISHNFSSKIISVQKAYLGTLNMLENSATKAAKVANDAIAVDTGHAAKIAGGSIAGVAAGGGSGGAPGVGMAGILSEKLKAELPELMAGLKGSAAADLKSILKKAGIKLADLGVGWADGSLEERFDEVLSTPEATLLKEGLDKLAELAPDEVKGVLDLISNSKDWADGDYEGVIQGLSKDVLKKVYGAYSSTLGIEKTDAGKYAAYTINLVENMAEAGAQFYLDPSAKNFGRLLWNASVQPILDTADDDIEKWIKIIPGAGDFYYDKMGAENIGDVGGIALGEYYSLFSDDPAVKEYAANYYESQGGLFDGIWNAREEAFSFVKDSGGVVEAGKQFFKTAAKDAVETGNYVMDNAGILVDEGVEWAKNIGSFVSESGGIAEAGSRFAETAAKDAWNYISDTAKNLWHAVF